MGRPLTIISLDSRGSRRSYHVARAAGLVLTAVLLIGLVVRPEATLHVLWDTVIPLLPAVFLVAAIAIVAGAAFPRRAGFCNAICPVLPVEKLYGQAPLLPVGSARCAECSVCTTVGCIDLAGTKTVAQTLGPSRRTAGWLATPFGAFAAAFPGFIIGYFTTADGALATAPSVYLHVLSWSAASLVVLAGVIRLLRIPARLAVPALGGGAVVLYYWFAAPGLATAHGGGEGAGAFVRVAALALVGLWFRRSGLLASTVASRRGVTASSR
jgi:hypothetical protein